MVLRLRLKSMPTRTNKGQDERGTTRLRFQTTDPVTTGMDFEVLIAHAVIADLTRQDAER